ncbi:hypothetical protein TYRP_005045 [Tyrophagus putrescentiae]|nr:hypothetical protein TYRP_005045 [Tyrophagus putrescentiae]
MPTRSRPAWVDIAVHRGAPLSSAAGRGQNGSSTGSVVGNNSSAGGCTQAELPSAKIAASLTTASQLGPLVQNHQSTNANTSPHQPQPPQHSHHHSSHSHSHRRTHEAATTASKMRLTGE